MISPMSRIDTFRTRLLAREPMMGTFLKTPSPIVCEVLGLSPLSCVCIDAEHAPFGRTEIDGCIAALRAADMPSRAPAARRTTPPNSWQIICATVLHPQL